MRWAEHEATLRSMKEAGKSISEIADFFDVSDKAVTEALVRLRAKDASGPKNSSDRKGERWSPEENAALIAAGDKGEDFSAIAVRLNRTRWGCKVQYLAIKRGQVRGAAEVPNQRIHRQTATALAKQIRDGSLQHNSITAAFFGDPLPGSSALDQRRAGQTDPSRPRSLATGVQL